MTFPFENGPEAFERARKIKTDKYAHLAKTFRKSLKYVSIAPLVIGNLISWDSLNDKTLLRICSKKNLKLMQKLAVSDTIRYSRDIFVEYTSGKKQTQPLRHRHCLLASSNEATDSNLLTNVNITINQNSSRRSVNFIHSQVPPCLVVTVNKASSLRIVSTSGTVRQQKRSKNRNSRNFQPRRGG